MEKHTQVAIIGSGPAGLTAAIYAARASLKPILFAGVTFGGQLMTTSEVENYPGFPDGIKGPELMDRMMKQAKRFGADIVYSNVTAVDFSEAPYLLKVNEDEYGADTVIVAVGSTPRKLGLESEEKFWGRGVSTCATCDGAFYKDKLVAVVGGGDSAMEEATFLTRFAKKVFIIHRRDEFRASKIMQERALNNEKIEVIWDTEVAEVLGDQLVNGLRLHNIKEDKITELNVDGMFLAIGHIPQTGFLDGELELDQKGYIKAKNRVFTNREGVFVAGDVEDSVYQQAVTAAGMGCMAALEAEKFLAEQ